MLLGQRVITMETLLPSYRHVLTINYTDKILFPGQHLISEKNMDDQA